MRILFCNKYNYPFSGTEVYLFEAMELLRSKGHEVALFSMAHPQGFLTSYDRYFLPYKDFKSGGGWLRKAELACNAIYSLEARRRIRAMILDFRPDVAHVRNIYHHLSPSILSELKAQGVPVLYHLNDFKALCPSYNLVCRGEACEACKGGHFWNALKERCYPGRAVSMTLVAEAYFHKWSGTYKKCVDCFLAPSRFVRDKFVEHGWDPAKFEVLPHFQLVKLRQNVAPKSTSLLYFGRLSPEKGVEDLLRAVQRLPHLRLVVAGSGPELGHLQQVGRNLGLHNVDFAGHIGGVKLDQAIADASFTVLPSHAYETFGKTILESYAHARPVIASDLGSRRELVRDGETGLLYKTGDVAELASAIEFLSARPGVAEKMGEAGKELVQSYYRPEAHYEMLVDLYERLAAAKQKSLPNLASTIHTKLKKHERPIASETAAFPNSGRMNIPLQKRTLRVAFIGGRGVISKYSGIETYYEEVGKRLAALGHEITAYCRSDFTPVVAEHQGIRVVRQPTFRSKHLGTLIHTFLSTFHVLMQPCDVVHYHALGPALFSFIPRLAGKKTVVTVQGLDWQRKKWGRIASGVLRLGEWAAVQLPNSTIVVSRTLQRHYAESHGALTSYVPNGGLLREQSLVNRILGWGLEPGNYVLYLGRFSPEKGCSLLVEAFERLDTDVKLVLAGGSSHCDDYSRELRSHGSERIKILNWVSGEALDELLTNAMMFVLPSDLEGLSLALLDAMGAELCVLTSDVPENREAIGGAGFTFRRGDVDELADRLRFLIANPAVRKASGEAARRRIREHYRWDTIAAETERVYFETLGWILTESAGKKPNQRVIAPAREQRKVG